MAQGTWLAAVAPGNRSGSPEPNARDTGMTQSHTSAERSAGTGAAEITIEVNGVSRTLAVDPRTSLLDLLRAGLAALKVGRP